MTAVEKLKTTLLGEFSERIAPQIEGISSSSDNPRKKAKLVNLAISSAREELSNQLDSKELSEQDQLIILEYCSTVSSLEFRNLVWPYEYMALSRRMGELWERFCKAAWDKPLRPNVQREPVPSFDDLLQEICGRLKPQVNSDFHQDFDDVLGLIAPINMIEDEVFSVDQRLHVIDFKSGFGSNEKGNMLRLLAVGRAYRLHDSDVRLLFLVRQETNNNYLKQIESSGIWEVHTGDDAYRTIDELTGSNIAKLRDEIIDFESDLSAQFWSSLATAKDEMEKYFQW